MIRFPCPGCGATFTVDDSKGGRSGKCPKCQGPFTIPMPGAQAPAPAPAADPNEPVEIAPCPGCQMRLTVAASNLGMNVECPGCKTVFQAARASAAVTAPPQPAPAESGFADLGSAEEEPTEGRRGSKRGDKGRPSKRKSSPREDDADAPAGDEQDGPPEPSGPVRYTVIRKIGVLSAGKMSGAVFAVFSLIVGIFAALVIILMTLIMGSSYTSGFGMACGSVIMLPVTNGISGFISGCLYAVLYNTFAKMVGGIEVELAEK
ncbi:DUF3566 domain-containing protein [Fimbriiglobus ruber]|uniref:DUF3566 domain-containing protein n=1 Tax=Fimbriiglobus ruber TaxID=1908690 RepID=A0A225D3T8_9BACT|nr:DUF3566 domain-containing protein [Fimbriiglobus ruber]OWK36162.1 hypothetical protein FRUB_08725 [Fimbriiglobus ruber]